MQTYWEKVEYAQRPMANGITVEFYTTPETTPYDGEDNDGNPDTETQAAIDAGELDYFMVKAVASFDGIELACDYLGGCCYRCVRDFFDADDYASDMAAAAHAEALKAMQAMNAAL